MLLVYDLDVKFIFIACKVLHINISCKISMLTLRFWAFVEPRESGCIDASSVPVSEGTIAGF